VYNSREGKGAGYPPGEDFLIKKGKRRSLLKFSTWKRKNKQCGLRTERKMSSVTPTKRLEGGAKKSHSHF